ncbi:hypothetical protein HU675_0038320 [Bradyrhizobium septentrionale]|uniref:hypothetical protein n=1 Tax=Bradyrhizobium septentrionale TaxID=1404411 RepID=UPI00159651F4|nr:hypothetical protein [Bradyrhizobium septentrionale]UGY23743.1 hypothetical protein HU675_0038320 [Bradyrhizobium septentrionale]
MFVLAILFGCFWFILSLREQNTERRRSTYGDVRRSIGGLQGDPWGGAAYAPRPTPPSPGPAPAAAPQPVYAAAPTQTVVHHVDHGASAGDVLVAGMAGAMIGSALAGPHVYAAPMIVDPLYVDPVIVGSGIDVDIVDDGGFFGGDGIDIDFGGDD